MMNWSTKAIKEIIVKTQLVDPRKQPELVFTYIDVSSVSNKTLEVSSVESMVGKDAPSRARKALVSGDIIFATIRPTLKRIAMIPEYLDGSVCSTGYFVFRTGNEIYNRFLYYYLQSDEFMKAMEGLQAGASYPAVNDTQVNSHLIRYPAIAEQKRIAAILDQAFADIEQVRANTEQNLKNALELFESYLQQVFSKRGDGWEVKTVEQISDTYLGKMLDKGKNKGSLKPYLRNLNVQWFDIRTSDLLEMRFEDDEHERYLVKKGDLLICEGGYPGRGAIWNNNEEIYFQKALHRVRCHNANLNKWILYYLYLSDRNGTLKNSFTGAGIQHFTGKALKKLSLPVPPDDLIIGLLNKIDEIHSKALSLELVYQKKMLKIEELKKSILQKAFSAELTKEDSTCAA